MEHYETFNVLFYVRKSRKKKTGEAPIYTRITVKGKRAELATHRFIDPKKWDAKASKAKGSKQEIKRLNHYLDTIRNKIYEHHREMIDRGEFISAQNLKNRYLGLSGQNRTLIETFQYHNKLIQGEQNSTYAKATLTRYKTTLDHLKRFLKSKYKKDDIYLKELSHSFIVDFEYYFKNDRSCNHNTTVKYLKNLKKVINLAIKNDWLHKDPFKNWKATLKPVKREYLSQEELEKMENKTFNIERLEMVKDLFLFCCYTGLAFVDVDKLQKLNIQTGIDGRKWIYTERTKTKNESNLPLLEKAELLIKKYKEHPLVEGTERLFPKISNQKLNAYLKEIADLCGIQKNLTFHLARHTFATTVTLSKGVSIETVGAMLGHKNIRTTQIYSKVINQKVSDEMKKIK